MTRLSIALAALTALLFSIIDTASAGRLSNYGVWKGTATLLSATPGQTDRSTVYAFLSIYDGISYRAGNDPGPPRPRDIAAAFDLKAPFPEDDRVVYWINRNFTHPLADDGFDLVNLKPGFHNISLNVSDFLKAPPSLDLFRDKLVEVEAAQLASYDDPDLAITDVIVSFFEPAVENLADVWVWGQRSENGNGLGLHHTHMNQGGLGRLSAENGIRQDGGLIVKYYDHWEALFLAFPQQAVATDQMGQPLGVTFADLFPVV
ncbi:uncharacterized protein ColSpa_11276 [Colletotrichum spaethianum]|uniref:DUF2278 domain-containing protein n=1 Tax=Colletotrichum spaethianum TaxID=700344 RepID=A0AA37PF20_9PEZI|nr:uncharacterized protein ColSpa_11276 [Colletotrichum spaethianum]GKT51095.1 uncharacterized protein ColSpa_11276 [Colletotrichum spaethianum]